jgi:hypothetical protein
MGDLFRVLGGERIFGPRLNTEDPESTEDTENTPIGKGHQASLNSPLASWQDCR